MADTLTITDNRTGKTYEVPVTDGTIRAMDLRKITTTPEDFGMMTYDPAFLNTANCRSAITYIDGDKGVLLYRGYPIEQLAEESDYLETAYLILFGDLQTASQLQQWSQQLTEPAHQNNRAQIPARPRPRARPRRPLHPARRSRTELQHDDDEDDRELAGRSLLGARRRVGGALRTTPWRRERSRSAHAQR